MGAGATQANLRVSAPAHHRYITDSLMVVMNPRRIPECLQAFEQAPLDVAYVQGFREADALLEINKVLRATDYARYLIVSDDVIVTPDAIQAVVDTSRLNPHQVVTGYCNLDAESPLVNITRRPLSGDLPNPAAYDFYRLDELPAHGTIRTGFAGLALTCLPRPLLPTVLPLGWYGSGWASDFHLSKRLERAGVEIIAPAAGFVWHVKERWNEPDQSPDKRLHIRKCGTVAWQRKGRQSAPSMALITSESLKGGTQSMSEKIAEKDITKVNELGQNVVLVAAGQPIPEDLDLTGSSAETKAKSAAPENKARKSSASSKAKK